MNKNKFLPPLVCGFGAAAIATIPGFKAATCCVFVPLAAALSLVLYQKVNRQSVPEINEMDETGGKVNVSTALLFGFLTGLFIGLFSTVFEVIITLVTHKNEFVDTLPQTESMMKDMKLGEIFNGTIIILKSMASDITRTGFSFLYTVGIFFSNIIVDSVFGMLGGLIGLLFVNRKPTDRIN